jgi:hypothetical protein
VKAWLRQEIWNILKEAGLVSDPSHVSDTNASPGKYPAGRATGEREALIQLFYAVLIGAMAAAL